MIFLLQRIKKKVIIGINKKSGRNSFGRKTIFTQSGGYRQFLYLIDYKRVQTNLYILLTIEKNIKFTAFIGLVCFANGFFNYIIISDFMNKIDDYYYGFSFLLARAPTFLYNIPAGNFIHHIEIKPTKGAKLMRAAGTTAFIISQDDKNSFLKMKSGWLLKLSNYCIAIIGRVSNENHFITDIVKAGNNRKLGFRPIVRGISKNPCDHAHGGGEGTGSPPRAHKTWHGKLTKSPTNNTIVQKKKFLFKIFKK